MRIHHRSKISIEHATVTQAVQRINMLMQDISVTRDFVLADDLREEFFISPGAYCKIVSAKDLPKGTDLKKESGTSVGTLGGVPARSPIFSHPHYKDMEDLSEMEIEYRVIGD